MVNEFKRDISTSEFSEIWDYGTNNYSQGNALNYNGKGVHSVGSLPNNLLVSGSTFSGGNWGIYTRGINCNIDNNTMPWILTGMQMDYSPGCTFDIKNNTISAVNRGINFAWTGEVNSIVVNEQNTINLLGNNSIGIDVVETRGSAKYIYQNNISIGNGYKGINHESSESSWIYNNSIYANGTQAIPNVGISITGGRNNLTACNLLNSSMSCNNQGLYVSESANNVDIGNHAFGWLYDYQFVGTSSGSYFGSNQMGNANHGLIMGFAQGSFGARIGVQEHTGNRWTGTHVKGAKHYGSGGDRTYSRFIVNAQDPNNPDYKPNNFAEVVIDGWIEDATENASIWTCNFGIGWGNPNPFPRVFPRSEDYFVVNDDFDTSYDWGSRIWTDRRQLYRQILETEGGESLPGVFNEFFNTYANTSVAQFEHIERGIKQAYQNVASINTQMENNLVSLDSVNNDMITITEQLSNTTDSAIQAALNAQLNGLRTQRAVILTDQLSLNSQWQAGINNSLSSLIISNNEINGIEAYEQNQKMVNQIMLEKMVSNEWSLNEIEREQIEDIANQCPYFGGQGVYRARALAAIYSLERYDDEQICNQALAARSRATKSQYREELVLQPNPAEDIVTVLLPKQDDGNIGIELLNTEGKLIDNWAVSMHQDLFHISINDLARGIYYLRVKKPDGGVLNSRFIKN
ncbi:MAG: T9SS type A sorting domain-containing protein [Saprospiraceae bacterium]|nr:T9SS type A sorting domain-containing protein [Saprospiraceae bacterium]